MLAAIVGALTLAVSGTPPTDDELAGARVITGFPGHHPPPALRRMISAGEVSGVILFDHNVGGRHSVRRLTSELQSIPRPAGMSQPLLVTVDRRAGWSGGCRGRRSPRRARLGRAVRTSRSASGAPRAAA